MENQTRFDLNAAVENWRNELAAQPNLASDDRRELETHLRDAIAGFQQRGLNDEESFWLACRRVGQPQQLGEEFVKADPAKVWRERVFWMAIALLTTGFWSSIINCFRIICPNCFRGDVNSILFYETIFWMPIIWIAVSLALGRINLKAVALSLLIRSSLFFVVIATTLFLTSYFLQEYIRHIRVLEMMQSFPYIARQLSTENRWMYLQNLTEPCLLIALIAWLMPTQNRKTPKRA